jgi:hypothetical protein
LKNGKPVVVKPSGHGIGFLAAPFDARWFERENKTKWMQPLPPFVYEAWQWLIFQELDSQTKRPTWFDLPAVADLPINSPITWKQIGSPEWLKPFTRVLVPMLENKQMALHIAPWMSNLKDLYGVRVTSLGGSYGYLSRKHDGYGLNCPQDHGAGSPGITEATRSQIDFG